MRYPRLLSRRGHFDLSYGMVWSVVFGLGMRDVLGLSTDVDVPPVSNPPQVDDATASRLSSPGPEEAAAWGRWWSDAIVNESDPLLLLPQRSAWWSDAVDRLTDPVGMWANRETSRFQHEMLAVLRDPDRTTPEGRAAARVEAASARTDSLDASVVVVPVVGPCWLEEGRVLVVDEGTRTSPDYQGRLEQFLQGQVHTPG